MAKLNQLSRFGRIINRLSGLQEYVSTEDLLESMRGLMSEDQPYTVRTLQRDIQTIAEVFGVEIENRRGYGYHIINRAQDSDRYAGLLSDYEVLCFMKTSPGFHEYVVPEHRQQVISIDINKVLLSIAGRNIVSFNYASPRDNGHTRLYTAQPYYIKQSQGKWYLFALVDGQMRSFELGRFENYKVSETTFTRDNSITLDESFKYSFGIWDNQDQPVEDIILKVSATEWEYLKTFPIHSTQTLISENSEYVIFSLRLRITYDFIMDLMSRCPAIEVLEPKHLRKELFDRLSKGLDKNK